MRKSLSLFLLLIFVNPTTAQRLPSTEASTLAFTHLTVIDMTGAPPESDMTVVVTGNRITDLGPSRKVPIPQGAQVIDATGKFLIPGLWDMHFHIKEAERTFPLLIANGVTGVRNMGGDFQKLFEWRDAVAAGRLLGPRIIACGPVVDGPRPTNPDHAIPVSTAEEGKQAVDFLKRSGADFVKVYDSVPRDVYFAIVEESKKQGLPFVGHIPAAITMAEASNAGQKSVEHLGTSGIADDACECRKSSEPKIEPGFKYSPKRIPLRARRGLGRRRSRGRR